MIQTFRRGVIYKTEENQFGQFIGLANGSPILKNLAADEFFVVSGKIEVVAKDLATFYSSIARIFQPEEGDGSKWTIARWKAEIYILGKRVFEEVDGIVFEEHLHWQNDKDEIKAKMKALAYNEAKGCQFFASGSAKERCLEHSPSVIDLTLAEITKYYKGKTNDWRNLRDATFYAATVKDIVKSASKFVKEQIDEEEMELVED